MFTSHEIESGFLARYGHPLAIALIDIDFFKKVNDTHGHPAGDTVLKEISALLVRLSRGCDVVARYGGEEFALILPETGLTGAKVLAHRLRRGVEQHTIRIADITIPVTVSIGVAGRDENNTTSQEVLKAADKALYRAKKGGRNQLAT